ncbi:MAG: polysaccharide deacetylase family protein [Pyrinomonadaceae bacterium]
MKKTLLKTIYNLGGFTPFHWSNRDKVLILMYHRFGTEKNPYKVSGAEFAAHLEYLGKHNRVLPLAETLDYLKNEKSLPPNTVVITIDDGYADTYEIAFPILKKFGFPATLFAVTDFLDGKCWLWTDFLRYVVTRTKQNFCSIEFENYDKIETDLAGKLQRLETAGRINSRLKLQPNEQKEAKIKEIAKSLGVEIPALPTKEFAPITWKQAREMDANNLKIESHTVTHPILTNVVQTQLDFELQTSKQRLESILDRKVEHFCYPNGSFNETVWQSVKNNNYKCAVTTNYGFNEKQANQFLLNRISAQSAIADFAQSVSGFEVMKQKYFK